MTTFREKLRSAATNNHSLLCVGLDIDLSRIPCADPLKFCREIIDATSEFVCSYKPNLAFFESMGLEGWRLLEQVIKMIPSGIPVIGDGKRGDIGSTSAKYAKALFFTSIILSASFPPEPGITLFTATDAFVWFTKLVVSSDSSKEISIELIFLKLFDLTL